MMRSMMCVGVLGIEVAEVMSHVREMRVEIPESRARQTRHKYDAGNRDSTKSTCLLVCTRVLPIMLSRSSLARNACLKRPTFSTQRFASTKVASFIHTPASNVELTSNHRDLVPARDSEGRHPSKASAAQEAGKHTFISLRLLLIFFQKAEHGNTTVGEVKV